MKIFNQLLLGYVSHVGGSRILVNIYGHSLDPGDNHCYVGPQSSGSAESSGLYEMILLVNDPQDHNMRHELYVNHSGCLRNPNIHLLGLFEVLLIGRESDHAILLSILEFAQQAFRSNRVMLHRLSWPIKTLEVMADAQEYFPKLNYNFMKD